jgi:hypothetical protein
LNLPTHPSAAPLSLREFDEFPTRPADINAAS